MNLSQTELDTISSMEAMIEKRRKTAIRYEQSRVAPELLERIRRACVKGHSCKAIAKAYKVHISYVADIKEQFNPVHFKKVHLTLVERNVLAHKMERDGLTRPDISKQLDLPLVTINAIMNNAPPPYLDQQMRPWREVLENLTSPKYLEYPVYLPDSQPYRIKKIVTNTRLVMRSGVC